MSDWSVPSMNLGLGSGPRTVNVRVESQPAGAEAKGPSGNACRTPCSLALPANGTTSIAFALQGYQSQSVPVVVRTMQETWDNSEAGTVDEQVVIDPNPVFAALDPLPPPPPPRRSAPRAKPRAQPAPAPAPAPQFGPAPPPPGFR